MILKLYNDLDINLDTLGCVMLEVETLNMPHWLSNPSEDSYIQQLYTYKSPNPARYWINGWVADKTPHVTLLYGLLQSKQKLELYVPLLLKDLQLPIVEVESIGYFESPYPCENYYCIVAHIKVTNELLQCHKLLEFLPHINTFMSYKPHVTLVYIGKFESDRDNLIRDLTAEFVGKIL